MKRISSGDWIVWNPPVIQALGLGPDDAPPAGPALTSLIQFRQTKPIYSPPRSRPAASCLTWMGERNRTLLGERSLGTNDLIVWKIFHQEVKHCYYLNEYCCGKKKQSEYYVNIVYNEV